MSGISDHGLRTLRATATLVDVLPRLRVRITDGDRVLLTVARPDHDAGPCPPAGGDDGLTVPPCGFRMAVGRARRHHEAGGRLRFLDLCDEREPTVHLVVPQGDALLPGGIYQAAASGDRVLLLFLTDLEPAAAKLAMEDRVGTDPAGHIGLHGDRLTRLTAVHTMAPEAAAPAAAALMTRLLEACVAAEAIAELRAGQPR